LEAHVNKWSKKAEAALQGEIFHGEKLMSHWPVGSNAVGCCSHADAITVFVLHIPQQ